MSDQYVRVPRELLERVARELERHKTPGAANRAQDLRLALAAPPEDVHAVVDEPVGYASAIQLMRLARRDITRLDLYAASSQLMDGVALYCHPQRRTEGDDAGGDYAPAWTWQGMV